MTENQIGTIVIEAAITVHRALGPGLLETVYEVVLAREPVDRGLKVDRQVPVAITYKGIRFEEGPSAPLRLCGRTIRGVPTSPFNRPRTSAGDGGVLHGGTS